jgi:chromosome segregation ATPase
MAHTLEERERLLSEARTAHREANRERNRVRKLAGRYSRKLHATLATARAQIESDRLAIDAKIAKLNQSRSDFHAASAADRDQLRDAWSELEARQKRLTEEWEEANRFQAEQAAALAARAEEFAARENAETSIRMQLQREIVALREEAIALEARVRNTREVVNELEQRRAELQMEVMAAALPLAEPQVEFQVALDRIADRDLAKWTAELEEREARLKQEVAAVQMHFSGVAKDKAELADRRRILAEQFAQLAAARAQWQDAERATVIEMEQLATTLRRRETELDAREQRLTRADSRRREDSYELWQLRLRLEAWQSKIVAYEMKWHTEREQMEADFAHREAELAQRQSLLANGAPEEGEAIPFAFAVPDGPPALPTELTALRDELERMAAVLLEVDLPEAPDTELPWGSEGAGEDIPVATAEPDEEADVLRFELNSRAA